MRFLFPGKSAALRACSNRLCQLQFTSHRACPPRCEAAMWQRATNRNARRATCRMQEMHRGLFRPPGRPTPPRWTQISPPATKSGWGGRVRGGVSAPMRGHRSPFPRTQTEAPASGTPLFGDVEFGTSFLHTTYCSTGHWSSSTVSRGGRLGPAPSTPTVAFASTPHDSRGQRQCRRRPGHWPSRLCRAAWKPALSR